MHFIKILLKDFHEMRNPLILGKPRVLQKQINNYLNRNAVKVCSSGVLPVSFHEKQFQSPEIMIAVIQK